MLKNIVVGFKLNSSISELVIVLMLKLQFENESFQYFKIISTIILRFIYLLEDI